MSKLKLSIIIPAKNEEKRIPKTLDAYLDYFENKYKDDFELIVVVNGSTDGTKEYVANLIKSHKDLKCVVCTDLIGKGGGIATGFRYASGDLVGYVDADNSTTPEMFDRLVVAAENNPEYSAFAASRNMPGSVVRGKTFKRYLMSRTFNLIVNFLFALGIKDTQCGAKLIRGDMLAKVIPYLTISNMAFDVNLLVDIKRFSGKILEVAIEWTDDLNTTIKTPFKTSFVMALSILRLRVIYSPLNRLASHFSPISSFVWKLLLSPNEVKYRKIVPVKTELINIKES